MIKQLINGQPEDCVATTDRGLLYGDGLFETVAVVDGVLCHWQRHLSRLQSGCERLGIQAVDVVTLEQECLSLAADIDRAVLKIIVTRGSGGRGYRAPEEPSATRIVQLLVERVDVMVDALEVRIRAEGLVSLVAELRKQDDRMARAA